MIFVVETCYNRKVGIKNKSCEKNHKKTVYKSQKVLYYHYVKYLTNNVNKFLGGI